MAKVQGQYIVEVKGTGEAEATIKRVAEAQKSVAANTDRVVTGLNRADGKAKKLGESFAGVGLKVAGITAALYAAQRVAGMVMDTLESGGRALALQARIDNLAGGADKVNAALRGLQNTLNLTDVQGFVLQMDQLGMSARQIEIATGYALALSETMGKELAPTLERVMQAMASGRATSFRALGIDASNAAEALEIMEKAAASMAASLPEASLAVKQIRTDWDDFVSDVEASAASLFAAIYTSDRDREFKAFGKSLGEASKELAEAKGYSIELATAIREAELAMSEFSSTSRSIAAAEAFRRQEQLLKGLEFMARNEQKIRGFWDAFNTGTQRAIERVRELVRSMADLPPLSEDWLSQVGKDLESRRDPFAGGEDPGIGPRGGGGGRRGPSLAERRRAQEQGFLDAYAYQQEVMAREQARFGMDTNAPGTGAQRTNVTGALNAEAVKQMAEAARPMKEILDELGTSMAEFSNASANMWAAIGDKTGSKKAIAVMQGFQRAQMAILAIVAGVKSVYEFAEMAASAARGDVIASVLHGVAGAQYAAVAGMNVTGAIMGTGGGGRGAASARSSFVPQDMRRQDSDGGGQITIIVGGDLVAGDEAAGSWTARALSAYAGRGGVLDPRLLRARGLGR